MLLCAYAVMLAAALWWNRADRRMLALTLVVGASVFIPVPHDTADHFYQFCIASEIVVALAALALATRASLLIAELCLLLVAAHITGWVMDGSPPFSPYRAVVKLLEAAEMFTLIIASDRAARELRNRSET
jgi:hypothetical protein